MLYTALLNTHIQIPDSGWAYRLLRLAFGLVLSTNELQPANGMLQITTETTRNPSYKYKKICCRTHEGAHAEATQRRRHPFSIICCPVSPAGMSLRFFRHLLTPTHHKYPICLVGKNNESQPAMSVVSKLSTTISIQESSESASSKLQGTKRMIRHRNYELIAQQFPFKNRVIEKVRSFKV